MIMKKDKIPIVVQPLEVELHEEGWRYMRAYLGVFGHGGFETYLPSWLVGWFASFPISCYG